MPHWLKLAQWVLEKKIKIVKTFRQKQQRRRLRQRTDFDQKSSFSAFGSVELKSTVFSVMASIDQYIAYTERSVGVRDLNYFTRIFY